MTCRQPVREDTNLMRVAPFANALEALQGYAFDGKVRPQALHECGLIEWYMAAAAIPPSARCKEVRDITRIDGVLDVGKGDRP